MANKTLVRNALLALAVVAALFVTRQLNSYYLSMLTIVGIYALALLGLDLIKGYAGLLSLGQAGFMGIAAYTSGLLTTRFGWGPVLALLAAIALVLIVALLMAIPGARLTGFNLALATLGFGVIMEGLFLGWRNLTGGASGIVGIPRFGIGPWQLKSEWHMLWLVVACLAVGFWLARNIVNSRMGRALRAIKEHELAASTLGVNVMWTKVYIFLIASVYSAVAGSLYAHYTRFISPDMVSWAVSTGLVSMLVLGGEASLWGAILGAALLKLLPEVFNKTQDYLMIIQGLILVVMMVRMPRGLAGLIRAAVARWGARQTGVRQEGQAS